MPDTDPDTKSRILELQAALATKVKANQEIVATAKNEEKDGQPVLYIDPERKKAFDRNLVDIKEIKGLMDGLRDFSELETWAKQPGVQAVGEQLQADAARAAAEAKRLQPGAPGAGGFAGKSLSAAFVESAEFKSMIDGGFLTMSKPWEVPGEFGGLLGRKDVYTTLPGTSPIAGGFAPVQRDPIVPAQNRRMRVRDLFPVQTTSAGIIEFFRVSGFTNAASTVAERQSGAFAAKPQSGLSFTGQQAPVRTIANWEVAHRNVLDDVPQLRGIIETELLYGLQLVEDAQILNGTGMGNDLLGILVTPGIQTYSESSGPSTDGHQDAIRRAMTLVILSYYEPTGIVVHPSDWEQIELAKDSQGRYIVAMNVAVGATPTLWRLPVVDTPAIADETALVGAFGLGVQLYDRQQSNIRIAEQHSDFFIRNAIVLLAEERLALAVKRPESLVKVTLRAD